MKTLIIHGQEHFIATRSAARKAYFINIRSEKKAQFKYYCLPATFRELAAEIILNQNQN